MELSLLGHVISIIIVNIVLSGDNALLIALATRNLPPEHRKKAVFWGVLGAVLLRITLTFAVVYLLKIPFIRGIGGFLLLIIAIKLVLDDSEAAFNQTSTSLSGAVKTIIIADLLMSLDNVLGVAGASNGNIPLLIFGLALSIPIVVYGSNFIQQILTRWPMTIYFGTAVLGWTAGEMLCKDLTFLTGHVWEYLIPLICSVTVIAVGKFLRGSKLAPAVLAQAKAYPEDKATKS